MLKLPSIYKTVSIDCVGDVTKTRWMGSFEVKCVMSNADRFEVERFYAKLLPADVKTTEERAVDAATLAELNVRVVSGPAWWASSQGGQTLVEMNPLYELMLRINEAQKAWSDEVDKLANMGDGNVAAPKPS